MRYFFVGAPYRVDGGLSFDDAFLATGSNTGNLLIGNGLFRELRGELVCRTGSEDPRWIEENFDKIVIPAANFIHTGFDFGWLYEFLRDVRLPVFITGLGAQSPTEDSMVRVPDGTRNFLALVSERAVTIGVRGYYTAEVLRSFGIQNVRVVGCPSIFTSCKPVIHIERPVFERDMRIVVNGSRNVVSHSFSRNDAIRVESAILNYAMQYRLPYVLQNEFPELTIAAGIDLEGQRLREIESIIASFGINCSVDQYVDYFRGFGRFFYSVKEWVDWFNDYDFSIGSRFHGNIAALLAGKPAVVVVHDSRTKEMCEFINIPHCYVSDLTRFDPRSVYENANYDLFELSYNNLYRKYVDFLDENGVEHNLIWKPTYPRGGRLLRCD